MAKKKAAHRKKSASPKNSATKQRAEELNVRIQKALDTDDIPVIYFNSFVSIINSADVGIFLERNGKPVAILNTSFTSAKTLAVKLNGLIQRLEQTGNTIMATEHVQDSLHGENNA
jgi:hypothetical protein